MENKGYGVVLRNRCKGWVQIVHALALDTAGGKQKMNCENTEGAFR